MKENIRKIGATILTPILVIGLPYICYLLGHSVLSLSPRKIHIDNFMFDFLIGIFILITIGLILVFCYILVNGIHEFIYEKLDTPSKLIVEKLDVIKTKKENIKKQDGRLSIKLED